MPYVGQTITEVFPTSISVDSATIKGDTTIGDASAADKKILFDGNAQDYHIGLDDSTDSLTIGLGSALGTTSHMVFDANGIITKPLQPAFQVRPSSQQNNLATNDVLAFGTEVFDNNADFSSNVFTAPVTGKYQINAQLRIDGADQAASYNRIYMESSNRFYEVIYDHGKLSGDPAYWQMNINVLADMDANDTLFLKWSQSGGSNQAAATTSCVFSGYLVC